MERIAISIGFNVTLAFMSAICLTLDRCLLKLICFLDSVLLINYCVFFFLAFFVLSEAIT